MHLLLPPISPKRPDGEGYSSGASSWRHMAVLSGSLPGSCWTQQLTRAACPQLAPEQIIIALVFGAVELGEKEESENLGTACAELGLWAAQGSIYFDSSPWPKMLFQ